MSSQKKSISNTLLAVHIAFIIVWLSNLASTDAYFLVYALIAFAAFSCAICNFKKDGGYKFQLSSLVISVVFSLLVIFANYEIFTQMRDPERIQSSTNTMVNFFNIIFSFTGGIAAAYPILYWIMQWIPVQREMECRSDRDKTFLLFTYVSFGVIVFINLIHLFLVEYPGNVTEDPFSQIAEMYSGEYSNFNGFWHTIFLQGILSVGYAIFADVNAAVAFYCIVQTMIVAAAFTYCLTTMYIAGLPKPYLFCVFLVYAVLPYNIALSITIWKDVLFAAGGLLMVSALYRILKDLGTRKVLNYSVFGVGGLIFALSRSNGLYVYMFTFLVFLLFLRKNKRLLAIMGSVCLACWLVSSPLLSLLGVSGLDYTEALSIPLQQVSRVVADGCELTEEEAELISEVLDLEEVPELYTNWLSDPIKIEFRSNNVEYFEENIGAYVKLWIRLGIKYPGEYFKAWVDQTKGYWNAGYDYAMYSETVTDNPFGVEKAERNNIVAKLFGLYFGVSRHLVFFQPLHSIGLHVWIVTLCCIFNAMKKREEFSLAVPFLVIILGLCFGTPVYSSFRYAYPVFVAFPLVVGTTVFPVKGQKRIQ